MKRSILKLSTFLLIMAFVLSCDKDDDPIIPDDSTTEEPHDDDHDHDHDDDDHDHDEEGFAGMESDWVRLTLMTNGVLDVMQADSGEIKYSVNSTLAEGESYYTSNSGRYLVAIDRAGGKVRFFDSGVEKHDDHGHEYPAKWVNAELNSVLPTHYAASEGHIVIFNDGDGSISYVNEALLEIPSYEPETFTFDSTVPHHGAGFRLDNGMFVTTFKNTDEPGGIPQMVKFVDGDGNVIDDNGGVEVVGIHGDAVNGAYGVFGSTDGIILVDNQQNIDLIPNIEGLNAESGNWLGTVKGHDESDVFFGRSRNKGVFVVDPIAKSMTNIYAGSDVANAMFSFDGDYFIVHTTDNRIRVFDGKTGSSITDRTVEVANIPELTSKSSKSDIGMLTAMEEPSPVLVASSKFLYVLAPNRAQIKVLEIEDLHHVHTIELDTPIISMMKNGFSIEGEQHGDHDH